MVRSGFPESAHRGAVAALGAAGETALRVGETAVPVFPRSSNKPVQAAAMVRCGLDLDGKLLALAAASHSGEEFHIAGVREILQRAGLSQDALRCPPALPLDEAEQARLLREGGEADRLRMNCSGKHAAMLATCVAAGWPTASYTDPEHPLQREIRRLLEELSGERVAAVGVDGCSAPLFAISLTALARAFRSIVLAAPGSAERKVADAMRTHPDWTSGSTRAERALMEAVPGLLVKSGAEGVMALALADGRAAAFKFDDGSGRAAPALAVAVLRRLGVAGGGVAGGGVAGEDVAGSGAGRGSAAGGGERGDLAEGGLAEGGLAGGGLAGGGLAGGGLAGGGVDEEALDRIGRVPVRGGGRDVGEIRVVLPV